jgi:hypothetical protein
VGEGVTEEVRVGPYPRLAGAALDHAFDAVDGQGTLSTEPECGVRMGRMLTSYTKVSVEPGRSRSSVRNPACASLPSNNHSLFREIEVEDADSCHLSAPNACVSKEAKEGEIATLIESNSSCGSE